MQTPLSIDAVNGGSRQPYPAMSMQTPLLLVPEQAAQELGIGRTAIFALIKAGAIESVKIGRCRRIPRAALEEYVERLRGQQGASSETGTAA